MAPLFPHRPSRNDGGARRVQTSEHRPGEQAIRLQLETRFGRPREGKKRAVPGARSKKLHALAAEAAGCRACPLWRDATQTVFGEGPPRAKMMLVGEQPGDQEDRAGRPFVGPAGRLLDEALAEAGIDRRRVYVTNAVKHFKWKARGARRIHDKPTRAEVDACRPWLDGELDAVRPDVLVLLGATAAQALLGSSFRVTQRRGEPVGDTGLARAVLATVHPSSILRERSTEARHEAERRFIDDLRAAATLL